MNIKSFNYTNVQPNKQNFILNNKRIKNAPVSNKNISFEGIREPKQLTSLIKYISKGFAKLIDSKPAIKLFEKTNNNEGLSKNLFSHLIVFGSTLLSGMYVVKTANNKNLDKDKRRTLAINQGFVFVVSTVMAYTFDSMLAKKVKATTAKFKKINAKDPNLKSYVKGISKGKSIIIIGTVYRFLAPVAVTPIANYIGNKIIENNKKVKEQKQLNKTA